MFKQAPPKHERKQYGLNRPSLYVGFSLLIICMTFLGAICGRMIAVLPDNASPLWPPAGITFVALLLLGGRYLPAVWIGLFLANVTFFYQPVSGNFDALSCICIASGTTLQAFVGAWLVNRLIHPQHKQWNLGTYIQTLLLGGPLSSVIGATIGTMTLVLTNSMPWNNFGNTWVLWWFGDTIGIFIVGGLLLCALQHLLPRRGRAKGLASVQSEQAEMKNSLWHIFSAIVLISMLGATIWAWAALSKHAELQDQIHFQQLTADAENRLENRLLSYQDVLQGVAGYINASEFITRHEWQQYILALHLNKRYPGMIGIGYVHQVPRDKLADYVAYVTKNIHPDFELRTLTNIPTDHPHAFVIQYIEPTSPRKAALGLDITSEPNRKAAAENARDTGKAQVSNKINLMLTRDPGFLLFLPVYDDTLPVKTLEHRRQAIEGWVYAPITSNGIFKNIVPSQQPEATFSIYDGPVSKDNLIYQEGREAHFRGQQKLMHTFPYAGKKWTIVWRTTPYFKLSPANNQPSFILVSGLVFTLLLAILLVSLNTTRDRAIKLAESVSGELAESNQHLREELEERHKIEEILSVSQERLNLALTSTNDGLWDWNVLTGEVYFSPRWIEMLGYELSEIPPHFSSWENLLHPDDKEHVSQRLSAHLKGECPNYQTEVRLKTKSGAWRWILTRGQVVTRDGNGTPMRMVGVHTDITERKMIEDALQISGERLSLAIACSGQGLWDWNVKTGRVYIDQSWFKLLGFDGQKASRRIRTWQNTVHHNDIKKVIQALNRHFKGKTAFCEVEYRQLNGKGEWVWVVSKGQVVERDEQGKPVRMIGTTQDITERKKLEQTLIEATAQAEQASKYKSEFLANMSHEIRTPMNGILGMTEITLGTDLDSEQRRYLEMVYASAQSLLTIINDILDFSKIEAGKLELEPIPFQFRNTLTEILYPFIEMARTKKLDLTYHISDNIPTVLIGDPSRLRQILNNLISNAIKFTSVGNVQLDVEPKVLENKMVELHFKVTDSGIGLSEEQKEHIFDPFMQADNSTSRRFGGTGLGLSITNQLVKMMHGKLWVDSIPNHGSTFHFSVEFGVATEGAEIEAATVAEAIHAPQSVPIELSAVPTPAHKPQANGDSDKTGLSILLAEDNAINQTVALHLLQNEGHHVRIANNGREAVDLWENEKFDLILMDMHMPEMDGFEATLLIRNREMKTGEHIPIVALTASALKGDRERCLETGMDEYLSKPFRKDELLAVITHFAHAEPTE